MVSRLFELEQRLAAAWRAAAPAEKPDTEEEAKRLLEFGGSLLQRTAALLQPTAAPAGAESIAPAAADIAAAARTPIITVSGLSDLGYSPDIMRPEALNIAAAGAPIEPSGAARAADLALALRSRAALSAYFRPDTVLAEVGGGAADIAAGSRLLDESERDPQTGLYFLSTDVRSAELKDLVAAGALAAALANVPAPASDDVLGTIYRTILEGRPLAIEEMNDEQLRCLERAAEWTRDVLPGAPDVRTIKALRARRALQQQETARTSGFVGRRRELRQLHAFVDRVPEIFDVKVVTGSGGSGKSALLGRLLADLRASDRSVVAWLDFDRPAMDPDVPHLLAFELSRQAGLHYPAIAEPLHHLRERLRQERTTTETIRQVSAAGFEQGQKAMFEMNSTLASLLRSVAKPGITLVLILDTFEEVTRRGEDAVKSVFDWLRDLRAALNPRNLRIIVSGRLYDEQLAWLSQPGAEVEVLDLPPLGRAAAVKLLVDNAVPRPLARTIARTVPNQPLPLLLVAQQQQSDPAFDLFAFMRDVKRLPERRRVEAFSSLVYWRNLARLRDPVVRVLAHPGLVLRRVTRAAITEVLVPALTAAVAAFEMEVLQAYAELRSGGLLDAPAADDAQQPQGKRVALAIAAVSAALALEGAAKPQFERLRALVGSAPDGLWQEYQATRADAVALRQLQGQRLDEAYAALLSYAWLVEKRADGAWHRSDLRRLILPHMIARRPGVADAIHRAAVAHYENSTDADDDAEAMYHRLMLAHTTADCDALDRDKIRSAAAAIRRDAEDLPLAANVFFRYFDGREIESENLQRLPPPEHTAAFLARGEKLVRQGRYDDVASLLAARPPDARFRAWESQARLALVDWPALAAAPLGQLDPSAPAADYHFRMHYQAFAAFLTGDLGGAARGFTQTVRFARRFETSADRLLLLRSVLYRLMVAHARGAAAGELSNIEAEDRVDPGELGFGLETARLALLGLKHRRSFVFHIDLLAFQPELLDRVETAGLADMRQSGLQPRVERTQFMLSAVVEEAKTMRQMLRGVDAIRRDEASLVGQFLAIDWVRQTRSKLYLLLRGPDPEFRDPLRTALARAFPARADREELAALVGELYPAGLEDLQPSTFAAAMERNSHTTLITLVEFIDRARLMREFARRALALRPQCVELERFVAGYERWCAAFDRAGGEPPLERKGGAGKRKKR